MSKFVDQRPKVEGQRPNKEGRRSKKRAGRKKKKNTRASLDQVATSSHLVKRKTKKIQKGQEEEERTRTE
jgi:hypothetical protein